MSLTRKMLKAMSIEEEKIDQIIEAHSETVNALKSERDEYKIKAEKLIEVEKELEEFKNAPKDEYKEKYEALKGEYDTYKGEQEAKEVKSAKEKVYRAILKKAGIDPKRIDTVLKVSNIDELELKDNKFADEEKIIEGIKTEWADFIPKTKEGGADVPKPPKGEGGEGSGTGRAAQLAKQFNEQHYGRSE